MSFTVRRQTRRTFPIDQPSSPGEVCEVPLRTVREPGLVDEGAVAHRDHPVGGGGDPGVVGDDDQGLPGRVQALEEAQQLQGGRTVEVAGRLVGQDHQRVAYQRAGDRGPLPLAAGQRGGQELRPVAEPDLFEQFRGAPPGGRAGHQSVR